MTEDELRRLIRDTVAKRLGLSVPADADAAPAASAPRSVESDPAPWRGHTSHAIYVTVVNVDEACVIEPGVACSHCNYCKSHGY